MIVYTVINSYMFSTSLEYKRWYCSCSHHGWTIAHTDNQLWSVFDWLQVLADYTPCNSTHPLPFLSIFVHWDGFCESNILPGFVISLGVIKNMIKSEEKARVPRTAWPRSSTRLKPLIKLHVLFWFACLFVWFFFVPLIWKRHHYRWRTANFDLCSALMAIEQWGFFSVPHALWLGATYIMAISEDPWHSHLLQSVWQWSCHYLLCLPVFTTYM